MAGQHHRISPTYRIAYINDYLSTFELTFVTLVYESA